MIEQDVKGNILVVAPLQESIELARFLAEVEKLLGKNGLRPIAGGAATVWSFTNTGRTKILDNTGFDIDSGSYKVALFLSTSNIGAASTTYAGVTNEVANANGYTTGGIAVTFTLSGTTTVTATFASN